MTVLICISTSLLSGIRLCIIDRCAAKTSESFANLLSLSNVMYLNTHCTSASNSLWRMAWIFAWSAGTVLKDTLTMKLGESYSHLLSTNTAKLYCVPRVVSIFR